MRLSGTRIRPRRAIPLLAAVLWLLLPGHELPAAAPGAGMTAVGLLAAFTGEDAGRFAPLFEFSDETRIIAVEVHAVGTDETTARYSGQEGTWYEVNNILRITTADGQEGISGVDSYYQQGFSDAHLQELLGAAGELVNLRSLDPVEVAARLMEARPDLADEVRASIDIALWDLAARRAGLPLHELLGARRDSIAAYASLPFYETLPEYVEAVHRYAGLGYTTFKFHVWGSIEEDLRLVERIQETFADSPYRFMIDLEMAYDLEEALRLGRQMDEGLFVWLEGPIPDELLEQYAELRGALETHIIPAGYSIYSPQFVRQGMDAGAWDAGRFDATVVGGISSALELLIIANEGGLTMDIQSWGHSLAQAANLHLMLANGRTRYFEAPMPPEPFEFGMKTGNFFHHGRVVAPEGPGLAVDVDWESLSTADFHVRSTLDYSLSAGNR